jgi:hypothetical protein
MRLSFKGNCYNSMTKLAHARVPQLPRDESWTKPGGLLRSKRRHAPLLPMDRRRILTNEWGQANQL